MTVKALAVVRDLMFKSRLMVAARETGAQISFAVEPADVVARASAAPPDVVLLDLNQATAFDAAAALRQVAPGARYVGFYSHVREELKRHADAAGIEPMPHSAFVQKLPELLARR